MREEATRRLPTWSLLTRLTLVFCLGVLLTARLPERKRNFRLLYALKIALPKPSEEVRPSARDCGDSFGGGTAADGFETAQ